MKNASKIPTAYYQTNENGKQIASAMHSEGNEAIDHLDFVINIIEDGIRNATNETIAEELRKAMRQMNAAKIAYRNASDILSDKSF